MVRSVGLSPRDAKTLYDYNRTVFEKFERRVRRLPGRGAFRKRGIGHESFFDTLVHVLNVHEVWLVYIVRGRTSDAELKDLFGDASRHPKDWKGFRAYAKRVWSGVDATIAGFTPRSLGAPVQIFWMPGRYTIRDAVLQATIEQAHHLGEMIGAYWQEDHEFPDMTWIDIGRFLDGRARRR